MNKVGHFAVNEVGHFPVNKVGPFDGILHDRRKCLHCGEVFIVGKYKVFKEEGDDFLYISCPNAPECNGTVIDWLPADADV